MDVVDAAKGLLSETNMSQTVTVAIDAIEANTRYIHTYSLILAVADMGVRHCGVIVVTDDDF